MFRWWGPLAHPLSEISIGSLHYLVVKECNSVSRFSIYHTWLKAHWISFCIQEYKIDGCQCPNGFRGDGKKCEGNGLLLWQFKIVSCLRYMINFRDTIDFTFWNFWCRYWWMQRTKSLSVWWLHLQEHMGWLQLQVQGRSSIYRGTRCLYW